jgi:SAM-dependent methyltransferase
MSRIEITDPKKPHLGGNIAGGDKLTYMPLLWQLLLYKYKIKSVLDVGCGEGHAMEWFNNHKCTTLGIEGLKQNVDTCTNKNLNVIQLDLTEEPYQSKQPFDLIWCCETLEHIEKKYLDNVIQTLSNGKIIAMTCAVPNQAGYHHVNCQPLEYWIDALKPNYQLEPKPMPSLQYIYWVISGMVFIKI